MVDEIIRALNNGREVLWLVCGGSNIPAAAIVLNKVKTSIKKENLKYLTIAQTDERYGHVGHADSNWQQMLEAGMDFNGIQVVPVLTGKTLEETIDDYAQKMQKVFGEIKQKNGSIIAQFGIGADGHIAGLIPHSSATKDSRLVSGFVGTDFTRISLTFNSLRKIDTAFAFAFGKSKYQALERLKNTNLPLEDQPSVILKEIERSYLYTDVFMKSKV